MEHAGKMHEFFYRDVIDCIKEIYGRHDFVPHLKFKPERHYADADRTIRIYSEVHTGRWWWEIQVRAARTTDSKCAADILLEGGRETDTRRNHHPYHTLLR